MTAIPLRRWLSKQPQPSMVVADFADGSEKKVRIGVARSKFRDAEESLKGAVRCEALDDQACVLRTWESGEDGEGKKAADPTIMRDIELAKLLAHVSDQAVARYEGIMRVAFEQNAKLLSLVGGRLAAIERAWHDSLIAQAEAVQAQADEQSDPNAPLVAQIVAQALGAGLNGGNAKEKG